MQTQSHFIMTAALGKLFKNKFTIPKKTFLLGSIAPDLPLVGLTLGGLVFYKWVKGWSTSQAANHMFGHLYFENPWWIALHNLLHSPTLLILALACLKMIKKSKQTLHWFFYACLFHSGIDVVTHVNDGPVVFFPFNWSYRFSSPISYWDPKYYGREFTLFETGLDLFLLGYLLIPPMKNWWHRKQANAGN